MACFAKQLRRVLSLVRAGVAKNFKIQGTKLKLLPGRVPIFKNLYNLFRKKIAFRYPVSELLDYKNFQKTTGKTIVYCS